MEKYASHKWMHSNTYNALVEAFGKKFDEFTTKELSAFCFCLGQVGLRQEDIL